MIFGKLKFGRSLEVAPMDASVVKDIFFLVTAVDRFADAQMVSNWCLTAATRLHILVAEL
jgi:hypothetical protein